MTTATAPPNDQAKPPMHSGAMRVRMAPHLLEAISDAARQRGVTASAWLREAATTLARFEGTLPTIASRSAGELYDRDADGRQRWARIENGEIKSITHSDAKPDSRAWVPIVHEDSEPFDIATQWRLKPHFVIDADRVICTFPVVPKSWEHA
jgi:hypothetical protein